jgi:hypothetical protein
MVIIEGLVDPKLTQTQLAQKITEVGLCKLILANDSEEAPFMKGSKVSDITCLEARQEITRFQEIAKQIGCSKGTEPFFMADHLYCNLLKNEVRS